MSDQLDPSAPSTSSTLSTESRPADKPPTVSPSPDDGLRRELDALREEHRKAAERLEVYESKEREAERARKEAEAEKAKKTGDADAVAKHYQERLDQMQAERDAFTAKMRNSERDREVMAALASHQLVNEYSAQQLMALWADQFIVDDSGDQVRVVDKTTRKPVREAVTERLATPEYSVFVAPRAPKGGVQSAGRSGAVVNRTPADAAAEFAAQLVSGRSQGAPDDRPAWAKVGLRRN